MATSIPWVAGLTIEQAPDAELNHAFDFTSWLAGNPDIPEDDMLIDEANTTVTTDGDATVDIIGFPDRQKVHFWIRNATERQTVTVRLVTDKGAIDDFSIKIKPKNK